MRPGRGRWCSLLRVSYGNTSNRGGGCGGRDVPVCILTKQFQELYAALSHRPEMKQQRMNRRSTCFRSISSFCDLWPDSFPSG